MSWNTLRTQIGQLLEAESGIQEVANYPKLNFAGYPAAIVVPSDNESDYETTSENERTYAFRVQLYYETKNTSISDAVSNLGDVVDSVLDTFDEEDQKGSSTRIIGQDLPSNYTFLNIWATPSAWGRLDEENLILAELTVRVRLSVDIT